MVAFSLWGFSIYWYGIFYAITFLFAYFFLSFITKKAVFRHILPGLHDLLTVAMDDIFLYSVLGVLIGGRLGHIFIYDFAYYLKHPVEVIMVWKGGMSFIGGIIGVISALVLLIVKYNISLRVFFALGDLLFIPTAFGIMIGRVGNFLNQELYGIPVSESIFANFPQLTPLAIKIGLFHIYSRIDTILRINTNMISSVFEGAILLIILVCLSSFLLKKKTRLPGLLVGIFFVWYSVIRFLLEYRRSDSQLEFIGMLTKSQWFFVCFAFLGGVFLIFRKRIFAIKR
ncbi:MAG: prolipoprotein diacylglyceryl transferase [Candidatus Absconditabacteria bacterium]